MQTGEGRGYLFLFPCHPCTALLRTGLLIAPDRHGHQALRHMHRQAYTVLTTAADILHTIWRCAVSFTIRPPDLWERSPSIHQHEGGGMGPTDGLYVLVQTKISCSCQESCCDPQFSVHSFVPVRPVTLHREQQVQSQRTDITSWAGRGTVARLS